MIIYIFVLQENSAEMLCWSAEKKQDFSPWPRVLKTLKHYKLVLFVDILLRYNIKLYTKKNTKWVTVLPICTGGGEQTALH